MADFAWLSDSKSSFNRTAILYATVYFLASPVGGSGSMNNRGTVAPTDASSTAAAPSALTIAENYDRIAERATVRAGPGGPHLTSIKCRGVKVERKDRAAPIRSAGSREYRSASCAKTNGTFSLIDGSPHPVCQPAAVAPQQAPQKDGCQFTQTDDRMHRGPLVAVCNPWSTSRRSRSSLGRACCFVGSSGGQRFTMPSVPREAEDHRRGGSLPVISLRRSALPGR